VSAILCVIRGEHKFCFAGPYAIGLIKDKMGSLHWGLAFVGISIVGVGDVSSPAPEKGARPISLSFAGPRPNRCKPAGNSFRSRNFGLQPLH
jgi:hypothetical protein